MPFLSNSLLQVKDLKIQIGRGTQVRGADLSMGEAQSMGVVGESGSGKSLTALAILGLLPETAMVAGEILWRGENLLKASKDRRRQIRGREIAMIFQDPMSSLNPSFTVGFQIDEVLKYRLGVDSKEARRARGLELLASVGIPAPAERWNAYPHQLSGGMSQRVSIAMALAGEPELLIADEPTTALDVTVQMQILELLTNLKRERKMSMLFVTHDLAVAAKVCDDITVFYAGRTVERNSARDLLEKPAHPYTQALLLARPQTSVRTRLASIPGSVPRPSESMAGCVFSSRCEKVMSRCQNEAPSAFALRGFDSYSRCFLNH